MVCRFKVVNIFELESGRIFNAADNTFDGVMPLTYAPDSLSTMLMEKY